MENHVKCNTGIKICIRMDDITPDMDWTKFLRFKELCDLYQVKPLIGIVPKNLDDNLKKSNPENTPGSIFWEYVNTLQKEGWSIAQHGFVHIYATKKMGLFPLNKLSEFSGLSYDEQFSAIKSGQDILRLHGIKTEIFMAPAHSYDKNTLKALKKLGFTKITDGFGKFPYTRWGLTFYPISYRQGSSLKKKNGYTTFVVHSNTMDDKDFKRYERLFEKYREQIIPYSDFLGIPPVKRGICGFIKEYVMALAKYIMVSARSLRT